MFSVLPTFVCNVSCVCVSTINSCPKLCYVRAWGHLKSGKEQVSRGGTNNYIPQYLWDVITCPCPHYSDVIMSAMATQTPGVSIVYSTVFTGVDQRKHLSSVSLTFVKGIHYLLVIGKFPTGRASNVENVSIWWRHHALILASGTTLIMNASSCVCVPVCAHLYVHVHAKCLSKLLGLCVCMCIHIERRYHVCDKRACAYMHVERFTVLSCVCLYMHVGSRSKTFVLGVPVRARILRFYLFIQHVPVCIQMSSSCPYSL